MLSLVLISSLCWLPSSEAVRCVFLHGAGCSNVGEPTPTDTDGYWGGQSHLSAYSNFCTEYLFNHDDTRNQGFDDQTLMERYCSVASYGTMEISNTVIVTHSMGNLILGQALREGVCTMDKDSTYWLSISAPWEGSKACDWLQNICDGKGGSVLQWLAKEMSYCDNGKIHQAYVSMKPSNPVFNGLKDAVIPYVDAAMCGTSAYGLTSVYSAAMEALSAEVQYGEKDDGMVGITSCLLGPQYGNTYKDKYYAAAINHADGTLREGNGDFGKPSRQPANWLLTQGSSLLGVSPRWDLVHKMEQKWAAAANATVNATRLEEPTPKPRPVKVAVA